MIDHFVFNKPVDIDGFQAKDGLFLPIIDSRTAATTLGISEALVKELLKTLIETMPEFVQAVERARSSSDLSVLLAEVHKLHGITLCGCAKT